MDANIDRRIANLYWKIIDNLAYKIDKLADLYDDKISKEYEKERKEFDIKKDSNILHIGCGVYPITAITLAKNNGIKITSIDNNIRSIKLANNLINKKELKEKIKIEQGNGTDYPVEEFDTIIVSGCASPKIKILEHIFGKAKPLTKIIVRETHLASGSLIKFINSYDDVVLVKKRENRPSSFFKPFGWQSFYLTKK